MLVVGLTWGVFWMPMRLLNSYGVGGAWVSVVFFAVMMLSPLPWIIGRSGRRPAAHHAASGILLGTAFTFYTCSLLLTDVVHAILLFYLTPIWSVTAELVLFGKRLTIKRGLAIALGMLGMTMILGGGQEFPYPRNAGDWIALASGMLWAAGSIIAARSSDNSIAWPILLFGIGGLISSLAFVYAALLAGSSLANAGTLIPNLPLVIAFSLVMFVPSNALVLWAQQKMDAPRVGILLMGEVVVGSITAALFSGETFTTADFAGTALIIGASATEILSRSD